jgi:hypothetical protein
MKLVLQIALGIVLAIVLVIFGLAALGSSSSASTDSPDVEHVSLSDVESSGDGTYLVNEDAWPGTYKIPAPTGERSCYWARLRDLDGDINSIIANNITHGPSVIHIAASDYAVEFSGCDTSGIVG